MTRRASKAFRVGNFKAFADTQRVPLRPITLVFGPNSAGKSSFVHSLALAHEAMRSGRLDIFRTDIGGTAIDLGGFRQYVHKTERHRRTEWGVELDVSRLPAALVERFSTVSEVSISVLFGLEDERDPDQLLMMLQGSETSEDYFSEKANPEALAQAVVMSYELFADGTPLLRMSRRKEVPLQLDRLDRTHPVIGRLLEAMVQASTTTGELTAEDLAAIGPLIDDLVPGIAASTDRFLPMVAREVKQRPIPLGEVLLPISRGQRKEDLENVVRLLFPRLIADLINGINDVVRSEMEALSYLGPLRSFPSRHIAFAEHDDRNWFAGGGHAWDIVRQDKDVREAVNKWLGANAMKTPYRLGVRTLFASDQMADPLADALEEMVGRIETFPDDEAANGYSASIDDPIGEANHALSQIRKSNVDRVSELVLVDLRTKTVVSHRDVGIGISQVLPVLVMAYASHARVVAMEQPEIHLHPALQAELADVFIEATVGARKNTLILETHSEHLILRLLRRIRQTTGGERGEDALPFLPEDLCVLYVRPTSSGSVIEEIPVTVEGEFARQWPEGFFSERAKELFD